MAHLEGLWFETFLSKRSLPHFHIMQYTVCCKSLWISQDIIRASHQLKNVTDRSQRI